MKKKIGFTLVELLIAVSIIVILVALSVSTFANFQKNSRDAKRKVDLETIRSGLEQYRADQGFYPRSVITIAPGQSLTSSTGNPNPPAPTRTYLKSYPLEPGSSTYIYQANPSTTCNNSTSLCLNYCLFTTLENSPNPTPARPPGCTVTTYNDYVTAP